MLRLGKFENALGAAKAAPLAFSNLRLPDSRQRPHPLARKCFESLKQRDHRVFTEESRFRGGHLLVVGGISWIDNIRETFLRAKD